MDFVVDVVYVYHTVLMVNFVSGNSDEPNGKEDEEDVQIHVKKGKFHWEKAITEVLTSSSEKEMSLKRLRKKVKEDFYSRPVTLFNIGRPP